MAAISSAWKASERRIPKNLNRRHGLEHLSSLVRIHFKPTSRGGFQSTSIILGAFGTWMAMLKALRMTSSSIKDDTQPNLAMSNTPDGMKDTRENNILNLPTPARHTNLKNGAKGGTINLAIKLPSEPSPNVTKEWKVEEEVGCGLCSLTTKTTNGNSSKTKSLQVIISRHLSMHDSPKRKDLEGGRMSSKLFYPKLPPGQEDLND